MELAEPSRPPGPRPLTPGPGRGCSSTGHRDGESTQGIGQAGQAPVAKDPARPGNNRGGLGLPPLPPESTARSSADNYRRVSRCSLGPSFRIGGRAEHRCRCSKPRNQARERPCRIAASPPASISCDQVVAQGAVIGEQGVGQGGTRSACRGAGFRRAPGKRAQSSCKPAEQRAWTQPSLRPLDWLQAPWARSGIRQSAGATGRKPTRRATSSIRSTSRLQAIARDGGTRHGPAPVHPLRAQPKGFEGWPVNPVDRPDPLSAPSTSTGPKQLMPGRCRAPVPGAAAAARSVE